MPDYEADSRRYYSCGQQQFIRDPKRRTHQNLWEYINSFRINRAAQLTVETQLPISEIGPRCGFTNVSNFNHLFRAHLGTTPSDYRSRFKTSPLTPDTTN